MVCHTTYVETVCYYARLMCQYVPEKLKKCVTVVIHSEPHIKRVIFAFVCSVCVKVKMIRCLWTPSQLHPEDAANAPAGRAPAAALPGRRRIPTDVLLTLRPGRHQV